MMMFRAVVTDLALGVADRRPRAERGVPTVRRHRRERNVARLAVVFPARVDGGDGSVRRQVLTERTTRRAGDPPRRSGDQGQQAQADLPAAEPVGFL